MLIKVHAASLNPLDSFSMRGPLFFLPGIGGLLKPQRGVIGCDIAGQVEAVGKAVKQLRPGDEVFGGIGLGGFAEYACAREDELALKPANLSFEEAAAVPIAAITALQALRDKGGIPKMNTRDLDILRDLLEAGSVVPVIDRRYPLSGAADAFRYREEGHARGKVVLTVVPAGTPPARSSGQ